MTATTRETKAFGKIQWWIVAGVGVVMVVVGLLMPRMLAGPVVSSQETRPGIADRDPKDYAPPRMPSPPDLASLIWRLMLGTGVVLALSAATLWFGKRWLVAERPSTATDDRLQQVASLALAPRCRLHLIRVGKQEVLVGTDTSGVRCMVTLPEPFDETLGEVDALVGAGPALAGEGRP